MDSQSIDILDPSHSDIRTQKNDLIGKKIPNDPEIEQHILGALLNNNLLIEKVSDFLKTEYFYVLLHQKIYEKIILCHDKNIIATPITISHYLNIEEDEKEDILKYIVDISTNSSYMANIMDYTNIVYELYLDRQLLSIADGIVQESYNTETHPLKKIEVAENKLFQLASFNNIEKDFQRIDHTLVSSLKNIELAHKRKQNITGIATRLSDLDEMLGGLHNSDLIILAARPSMGKTALALNIALNCCKELQNNSQETAENIQDNKASIGFFSLEMSSEQLALRLISLESGIDGKKLRTGFFENDELEQIILASKDIGQLSLFIDDTPALSISAIRVRARRLKRKHNLSMIIIDYLQLVKGSSSSRDANRVVEVSEVTQGLKAIAKELNIPVIALSQLSRAVEQRDDKKPQLSDLRESGSIEQDSDIVMFLYREEYYLARKEPKTGTDLHDKWQEEMEIHRNKSEVIIAKHRNGPIGSINLRFDSKNTRFNNYTMIENNRHNN